jgi:hypothetical protein
LLPDGKQKNILFAACEEVEAMFEGRILSFDQSAAYRYAEFRMRRRKQGRAIAEMDMAIAAIASVHSMTVATGNTRDFEGLGVPLVDPFTA